MDSRLQLERSFPTLLSHEGSHRLAVLVALVSGWYNKEMPNAQVSTLWKGVARDTPHRIAGEPTIWMPYKDWHTKQEASTSRHNLLNQHAENKVRHVQDAAILDHSQFEHEYKQYGDTQISLKTARAASIVFSMSSSV